MSDRQPHFIPGDYFQEIDPASLFPGRGSLPLDVDIGCGDGDFLVAMALANPDRNYLGVERYLGRVRHTGKSIAAANLPNARVLRLECAYTVGWLLPRQGVSRLYLLFPDPWPKKRHHRRRLFRDPEFFEGLAKALVPDGEFFCKTDDLEYHEDLVEYFSQDQRWKREDWDAVLPTTAFELLWLSQGKGIQGSKWLLSADPQG